MHLVAHLLSILDHCFDFRQSNVIFSLLVRQDRLLINQRMSEDVLLRQGGRSMNLAIYNPMYCRLLVCTAVISVP
jgi:hypothetical protein